MFLSLFSELLLNYNFLVPIMIWGLFLRCCLLCPFLWLCNMMTLGGWVSIFLCLLSLSSTFFLFTGCVLNMMTLWGRVSIFVFVFVCVFHPFLIRWLCNTMTLVDRVSIFVFVLFFVFVFHLFSHPVVV